MCSSSGRPFVHAVLYGMFSIHLCKQSSRWKDMLDTVSSISFHLLYCLHKCMENIPYKTACTNGLPDDEHMMYATCRNINLKSMNLLVYVTRWFKYD